MQAFIGATLVGLLMAGAILLFGQGNPFAGKMAIAVVVLSVVLGVAACAGIA